MDGSRHRTGETDRLGFDDTSDWLREAAGKLVPRRLARRAVAVSVSADPEVIRPGEPVTVTIEFENRLPVPVTVTTPRRRLWGWAVDGELAASDERRYTREAPGAMTFRGGERKRVTRTWRGRFERTDDATWVDADPGEHEITAFLATADRRPSASTTVRVLR